MNKFYLYILRCSDNSYYVGQTDNLEKRVSEHSNGRFVGYTSTRLPVIKVYDKVFSTRAEALLAEKKVKPWARQKKEALIRGDFEI